MSTICGECSAQVFDHELKCRTCCTSQGFPNVRIVGHADQKRALSDRVRRGRNTASRNGASAEFDRVVALTDDAKVAFNRSLLQILTWLTRDDQCFRSAYWHFMNGRTMIPDKFNIGRPAYEYNINPNYARHINFAYVDVGHVGIENYGPVKVVFKNDAIRNRTTFLEENCYFFARRHLVVDPTDVPPGYRATWDDRGLLAAAKLAQHLRRGMSDDDLRWLLIHGPDGGAEADFVEAHICDDLHINAIDTVYLPARDEDDPDLWISVRTGLTIAGARVIDPA